MRPKYRNIVARLAEDIRTGVLKPGDRLPTHRELAHEHGLSLGTATRVFAEMEAMGLTVGEVGRGTFVRMNADAKAVEFSLSIYSQEVVDFSRNHLVLPEQTSLFEDAIQAVLSNSECNVLDYRNNAGSEFDRRAATLWLNKERGVSFLSDDSLTICSGGQHALMLALMATCKPGQGVAVESLTYPVVRLACEMLRLDVFEVESDESGIVPEAFDKLCTEHSIRVLFCMPNVQNPTSTTLSPERRDALATILKTRAVYAIEDDAYGFLLESPPCTLSELAPENVFYTRTLSKSWAPGLRVCYLTSPECQLQAVEKAQRATVWMSTPLMMSVATHLINKGIYDSVVRAKRREIFKRQAILRHVLDGMGVITDPRSMHVLLPLPKQARTGWVLESLQEAQVIASPLAQFTANDKRGQPSNGLRLCIGAPRDRREMESGLKRIRSIVKTLQSPSTW